MDEQPESDAFERVQQQLRWLRRQYEYAPSHKRFVVPAELVPQIVAAVEARRQQGQSLRQLALQLGIPTSSLAAWCLGAEPAPPDVSADSAAPSLQAPMQAQTPGLRTVEVSANQPPAKADPQRPVKRSLTVRSPSGLPCTA